MATQIEKPMTENRSLAAFGFDSRFAWAFDESADSRGLPADAICPARVVRVDRGRVRVHDGTRDIGVPLLGSQHDAPPVVGDFVALSAAQDRVLFLLERRQLLARRRAGSAHDVQPLCANVDTVWLAAPADRLNLAWIERGVTLVRDSGATPVVLVTKADLHTGSDVQTVLFERHIYEEVHAIRMDTPQSYAQLAATLRVGQTAALLGPSGAGKSTLLNALLGTDVARTGAVRRGDSKGRHTTVRRELHRLPGGGLVIDTPGTRELGLTLAGDGHAGFTDIGALAEACRFADCTHTREPGCAVQAAIASGALPAARLESYARQQRELVHMAEKQGASHARRAREKAFTRMVHTVTRSKR